MQVSFLFIRKAAVFFIIIIISVPIQITTSFFFSCSEPFQFVFINKTEETYQFFTFMLKVWPCPSCEKLKQKVKYLCLDYTTPRGCRTQKTKQWTKDCECFSLEGKTNDRDPATEPSFIAPKNSSFQVQSFSMLMWVQPPVRGMNYGPR